MFLHKEALELEYFVIYEKQVYFFFLSNSF